MGFFFARREAALQKDWKSLPFQTVSPDYRRHQRHLISIVSRRYNHYHPTLVEMYPRHRNIICVAVGTVQLGVGDAAACAGVERRRYPQMGPIGAQIVCPRLRFSAALRGLQGTNSFSSAFSPRNQMGPNKSAQPKEIAMKGIVAYMLGVPVVVIILLYITHVF